MIPHGVAEVDLWEALQHLPRPKAARLIEVGTAGIRSQKFAQGRPSRGSG